MQVFLEHLELLFNGEVTFNVLLTLSNLGDLGIDVLHEHISHLVHGVIQTGTIDESGQRVLNQITARFYDTAMLIQWGADQTPEGLYNFWANVHLFQTLE